MPRVRSSMASLRRLFADRLPATDMLGDDEFAERHRAVLWTYRVVMAVVVVVGVAVHGPSTLPVSGLLLVPALLPLPAAVERRMAAMTVTSLGLLAACGLIIAFTGGLIESHFAFFVILPMIALYHDWRPFALAIGFVGLTHAVFGIAAPQWAYDHSAAIASPVRWGMVHAAYVLAMAVVMIVHWNFAERPRHRLQSTLDDLRSTQAQLLHAQKLESIGALAAGVAHEINTPIQYVADNLRFLDGAAKDLIRVMESWSGVAADLALDPAAARLGERIAAIADDADLGFLLEELPGAIAQSLDGVERVAAIVRAMKGFSVDDESVSPHDLNRLILDTVTVARHQWDGVAELELDLDDLLDPTPVPAGSFNQVLLNLVVNAAHAIEERRRPDDPPGIITVTSRRHQGASEVTVGDDGCGIAPEVARRVFDQFFTTKVVGRGVGQGLSFARSLVEGLGGSVTFESEVGVGTVFRLRLPSNGEQGRIVA